MNAKDYMIQQYINGEPVTETEWLLYYEHLMEEAERRACNESVMELTSSGTDESK